jgi:micrococcal nuclease
MRPFHALIIAGICYAGPAFAASLPACAGGVEVSDAKIMRVEKNGALILNDGRAVSLEGIRLVSADSGAPALANDALSALRSLAMARPLTMTALPPKEDRYDRVRVQAFGDIWIQAELLRRGLARVDIAPDRNECAGDLYKAEKQARESHAGLWALPAFGIRRADAVPVSDEGSFQIVEGQVVNAANHDGRLFLDFGADYRRGFSATIAPEDHAAFRNTRPPVEDLEGHTIRVRGMVENIAGKPEIAISNPAQIEFIQ